MQLISIVIPSYNEEKNIPTLAAKLAEVFKKINESTFKYQYEILFIDDGSIDKTLEILTQLNNENPSIQFISFSRNFGHQSALRCGLDHTNGDAVISMDADMQHPPEMIEMFLQKWEEGYDIVYTQREDDPKLPFLKKQTSALYYVILNAMSDTKIEKGSADFRLLDKKIVSIIKNNEDNDLFLRGFISWVGFKQYKISYMPHDRLHGTSKYTFSKMLHLAVNGIMSFSIKPLRMATVSGLILCLGALIYIAYAIYIHFTTSSTVAGWTSVLVSVLFIGGFQLFTLGIIGEYIGKLFIQVKSRPSYIISKSSMKSK